MRIFQFVVQNLDTVSLHKYTHLIIDEAVPQCKNIQVLSNKCILHLPSNTHVYRCKTTIGGGGRNPGCCTVPEVEASASTNRLQRLIGGPNQMEHGISH